MGAILLPAGCCCEECSWTCDTCEVDCNDPGGLLATVTYTPCGGASACAGLSGGADGVLNKLNTCWWSTDTLGGHDAGDFGVNIYCDDDGLWMLDIWNLDAGFCAVEQIGNPWGYPVCVFCIGKRPTGVFVVPMEDDGSPCGNATVTITPAP